MRIGIMGGTLDPVHSGHIQIAQLARQALKLDRVMLLPAGDPPHKENPTSRKDRLFMAQLAAQEAEGMFVCDMEVMREGTTYTVDTLTALRDKEPETEWVYIIGADTLDVLDTWRSFERVAKMCSFAALGRGDEPASQTRADELAAQYGARITLLPFSGPEISSSDIRRRVLEGKSIAGMVPEAVESYIHEYGLYLSDKSILQILRMLQSTIKLSRYQHTLGVARTAVALAPRFGVKTGQARLAALLHDCAKYLPLDEMRAMVSGRVGDIDTQELETESVLHAPAGMVYAQDRFGVRHPAILSAIRKHTLGDRNMSALDALIYTADFIEPNRKPFPGLEEARALAQQDIFAAARKCAELTNSYILEQGKKPHPKSISMLEAGIDQ